jgi:hypothetical protein
MTDTVSRCLTKKFERHGSAAGIAPHLDYIPRLRSNRQNAGGLTPGAGEKTRQSAPTTAWPPSRCNAAYDVFAIGIQTAVFMDHQHRRERPRTGRLQPIAAHLPGITAG